MHLFIAAVLLVAVLLILSALSGGFGALPVVLISLVAAAAIVFLWRGMDVRRPPRTRA